MGKQELSCRIGTGKWRAEGLAWAAGHQHAMGQLQSSLALFASGRNDGFPFLLLPLVAGFAILWYLCLKKKKKRLLEKLMRRARVLKLLCHQMRTQIMLIFLWQRLWNLHQSIKKQPS